MLGITEQLNYKLTTYNDEVSVRLASVSGFGEGSKDERIHWPVHIVIDPDLHHGDPWIKGTRIPVSMIIGSLADGMTSVEIQAAYPQLKLENIQAALAYVAEIMRQEVLAPFSVA